MFTSTNNPDDGGEFVVAQHDREVIPAAVTAITGEPVKVGDTYLTFLATLTPAVSGGVRFQLHSDGAVEDMSTTCGGCGRHVPAPSLVDSTPATQYAVLRDCATAPRPSALVRLSRRLTGSCPSCSPDATVASLKRISLPA